MQPTPLLMQLGKIGIYRKKSSEASHDAIRHAFSKTREHPKKLQCTFFFTKKLALFIVISERG